MDSFTALLKRHGLAIRVLVAVTLYSGLFALVVASIQLYSRYQTDMVNLNQRLADAEVVFLDDLRQALWRLDEPLIQQSINSISQLPFIDEARLITAQQAVFRSGNIPEGNRVQRKQYPLILEFNNEPIELGTLEVWIDRQSIYNNLTQLAWQTLAIETLQTLFLAGLVLTILQQLLFRHLRHMQRTAAALKPDNLDTSFLSGPGKHYRDELNTMLRSLESMRLRLKRGIKRVRKMQVKMRRIFLAADSSPAAVAVFKAENGIRVYSNSAYEQYFGQRRFLIELIYQLHPEHAFPVWLDLLRTKGFWQQEIFWVGDETPRWISVRCIIYRDDAEELIMLSASDISELKHARDEAQHLQEHDTLTGLPNASLGLLQVQSLLESAREQNLRAVLISVSLSAFRPLRESFGTHYADQLIMRVAELLDTTAPEDALLARSADDQFICSLILHQSGNDYLASLMEQLRARLAHPLKLKQQRIDCGFFAGVAIYPEDGEDASTLYQHSLSALHQAEEKRPRSRFTCFDSTLDGMASRKLTLISLLASGQALNELQLYYQPLVDGSTGRIVSCEALARWHNPVLGFIPPPEFIGAAEDSGQIIELGELILQTACIQLSAWRQLDPELQVSVNISPLQLIDADFEAVVENALRLSGLPPQALKLEVTEQLMLQSSEQVLGKLNRLQQQGIKLAIDDFGSGYASLNYLTRYPFELLKIDQSFIRNIPDDPRLLTLTRTMTELAHSLGLQVVAEGVETNEIAEQLKALRCDLLQGYLYSRPLPVEAFTALLKESL
ncbi:EAL domain-containing protein [Marinobacterium sp. AK62]|uniref:EAL domain-containing protein n=1 Tax=Marinobacterium alkalitolerans TaxID=1542925 RepID=A0ABS3ZCL6_9GAMM|nr:EAL domain-containing protein [Marinobacterium alkalitolerans]MBP0049458.1 EAL domain-containing protein [Marinobacterium alkalitolerans]